MANGYAISALTGKADIMSCFSPEGDVFMSGTFMGHLLGVTAALKTIDLLRRGEIHTSLWAMGDRIRDEINSVIAELDLAAKCYSYGSIWSLYFTRKVDNYRDVIDMASQGKGFHKDVAYRNHMLNSNFSCLNSCIKTI